MLESFAICSVKIQIKALSFNTFYEYSTVHIPQIIKENNLTGIDLAAYNYLLKDFYNGGSHEHTLKENLDTKLFDETFIVFEIDSINEDPLLFPLVTLIIMDVFIQKMRIKKKVLVIEEAILDEVKKHCYVRKKRMRIAALQYANG